MEKNHFIKSQYLKNQSQKNLIFFDSFLEQSIFAKKYLYPKSQVEIIAKLPLYKYAELKSNLLTENEGSSKKIIDQLLNSKKSPQNNDEQMVVNLNMVYEYIDSTKPQINLQNIEVVYRLLETNIDMHENKWDSFPRKGKGEVHGFETPLPSLLEKALNDLISFIDSKELNNKPLLKAHAIHIYWIYYHPTYDFNGRMGRILAYWYLKLNLKESFNIFAQSISSSLVLVREKYNKLWDKIRKHKGDVVLLASLIDFAKFVNYIYYYLYWKILTFLYSKLFSKESFILSQIQLMILINLTFYNKILDIKAIEQKINSGLSKAGIHKAIKELADLDLLLTFKKGKTINYYPNIQKFGITKKYVNKVNKYWENLSKNIWK